MRRLPKPSPGTVILLTCLCAAVPLAAAAHEGATGIVKERMLAMEDIGAAMKEITAMLRGQKTYDAARLAERARYIRDRSGDALTRLFPKGSLHGPSEAAPEIWQRWDRFEALARDLGAKAERLAAAAETSGDQARPGRAPGEGSGHAPPTSRDGAATLAAEWPMAAFANLAKSCAACHREFRIKERKPRT